MKLQTKLQLTESQKAVIAEAILRTSEELKEKSSRMISAPEFARLSEEYRKYRAISPSSSSYNSTGYLPGFIQDKEIPRRESQTEGALFTGEEIEGMIAEQEKVVEE